MQGLLFVLEIIFIMFLMSKRMISILLWVMSLMMFQMSYESGNEQIYLEAIEDYPIQDCVEPKKFRFLYKKLNKLSYKGTKAVASRNCSFEICKKLFGFNCFYRAPASVDICIGRFFICADTHIVIPFCL